MMFVGATLVIGDDFNRADAAAPGLGANWTAGVNYSITSNKAQRQSGGTDVAVFQTSLGTLNHWNEVLIVGTVGVQNPGISAINARGDGTDQNIITAFFDSGGGHAAFIGKIEGGAFTVLNVGGAFDISGSYTMKLECIGNTASLYQNGVLALTADITGLTYGSFCGLNANAAANPYDYFLAGAS